MAAVLLAACAAAASPADMVQCARGCILGGMRDAVCGDDRITYFTRCIAECQGVEVASEGPCSGRAAPVLSAPPEGEGVTVSLQTMRLFEAEGFK